MSATLSRPARGRPLAEGNLLHPDALLAASAALVLPLAIYASGQPGLLRLGYPALAFAAAGYLYVRRSPWYAGLAIWLFCASPLIRRLADYQLGFQLSSPILLAPYVACLFAALSFWRCLFRTRSPYLSAFAVILGCVGYGMFLAAIQGRITSGIVDVLKWGVGPLMAVHLLSDAGRQPAMHKAVVNAVAVAGPAMAAYGIAQYVNPLPWDVDWVANMILNGMTSMGEPAPYELRVFGTMNSPGSLGIVLLAGVILMIGRPLWLALPGMGLMLAGLALCQYRAIWAGTALGLLIVLFRGTMRERMRILAGGVALALASGPLIAAPEMQQTISRRVDSISRLASDESADDRLSQYRDFLESDGNLVLGEGLAITGASRSMDGKQAVVIDSGIIEVYTALGVFGGSALFGAIGYLVFQLFRGAAGARHLPLYGAVVAGTFVQFPFGSMHVGETGFAAWICLGLGLASIVSTSVPGRAR